MDDHADKIAGLMLGTAVGDALGLPNENLSRRRLRRWQTTRLFWPGVLPRNLLFLTIVLGHGFRRLLPPY
jgi:ADP-ribosylglycohydrolase